MNRKVEKVEIVSEREVNTYAEFWHTSYCLLKIQEEVEAGSFHLVMSSLVFTAFTLEAYFNHVGSKVFECWVDLERLGPREKLNVIAEKLGIEVNYSCKPWQVVTKIFQFRNDIAHGKSFKIKATVLEDLKKFNKNPNHWAYRAETEWEKYCTLKNAHRAREYVKEIVHIVHQAANFPGEYPFQLGLEYQDATLQR